MYFWKFLVYTGDVVNDKIIRKEYLDQLELLKDQKVVKVITGIRRSGKSTLLEIFRDELKLQGVKTKQIQSYNFEDPDLNQDLNWRSIYEKISTKLAAGIQNYIFLDEIQNVPEFEKLVEGLFIKDNVDLYITGSSAFLLSGELATLLTGRYISIHMLPFSFKEYVQMFPDEQNEDRLFEKYMANSAFPEVITLSKVNEKLSNNYLRDIYETIVFPPRQKSHPHAPQTPPRSPRIRGRPASSAKISRQTWLISSNFHPRKIRQILSGAFLFPPLAPSRPRCR